MPKPDAIPGWPNPTEGEIKLFQRNNRLKPDGIIGPRTRARIWPEPREGGRISYFARHRVRNWGAIEHEEFLRDELKTRELTLGLEQYMLVARYVSSEWETGFSFLSNEDGITYGFRRLAAGTLKKFCERYELPMRCLLGDETYAHMVRHTDQPTGGPPLCTFDHRVAWFRALDSKDAWVAQVDEWVSRMETMLAVHGWLNTSQEIVLAGRIYNSGSGLVKSYSSKYGRDLRGLVKGYTRSNKRRRKRTEQILEEVPNVRWR